jgi:predicted nucleic acid-binding protein
MASGGAGESVATDTSLLLNFLRIDSVELLAGAPGFEFHVINHVVAEVTQEPSLGRLQSALTQSHVAEFEMTDLAATAVYDELRATLGDGEAATIAAAEHLGWIVGMDERGAALRHASQRVGADRVLNTVGVLVHLVQTSTLTLAEAEQIRLQLSETRFILKRTVEDYLREVEN